jgi:hypothetical protein
MFSDVNKHDVCDSHPKQGYKTVGAFRRVYKMLAIIEANVTSVQITLNVAGNWNT